MRTDANLSITSIIMVNWRRAADTIECLDSIMRLNRLDLNVILCDNASDDGSLDAFRLWAQEKERMPRENDIFVDFSWRLLSKFEWPTWEGPLPFLTIVDVGENVGFAGANNVGLHVAKSFKGIEYVWLLNNDTVLSPDTYSAYVERLEEDRTIGQCGGTLLFYSEPDMVQALGGSSYRWSTGRGTHLAHASSVMKLPSISEIEAKIDYVSGASLFMRKSIVDRIGPLNEDYFLYYEEMDLALRSAQVGRLGWAPKAVLWHKEGSTIGSKSAGRPSDLSLYYLTRNSMIFTWRNRVLYLPVVIAVRVFLDGARLIRRGDFQGGFVLLRALKDFLLGRRGKLGKR